MCQIQTGDLTSYTRNWLRPSINLTALTLLGIYFGGLHLERSTPLTSLSPILNQCFCSTTLQNNRAITVEDALRITCHLEELLSIEKGWQKEAGTHPAEHCHWEACSGTKG
jgi:hypothetical protein